MRYQRIFVGWSAIFERKKSVLLPKKPIYFPSQFLISVCLRLQIKAIKLAENGYFQAQDIFNIGAPNRNFSKDDVESTFSTTNEIDIITSIYRIF